jgi:hypothetical protein
MRPPFFPLGSVEDVMNSYMVIASEYGFYPPDEMPIFRFQQLATSAAAKRQKRIEAANAGQIFTG